MTHPLHNQHILVTGAKGFVGAGLVRALKQWEGLRVSACVRPLGADEVALEHCVYWEMGAAQLPDLTGVDCIIHSAARVHQLRETAPDPLAEFRRINCAASVQLAKAAIAAGVKRFIYISSLHVLGHERAAPYTWRDKPAPTDPYAQSKWEAEQGLLDLADQIELVIVRPPLVYGPQAPGNFGRLVKLVQSGLPLPFGAINNRRSLVALDNLIDLLLRCCWHPAAVGQAFLVADTGAPSTSQLCAYVAQASACRLVLLNLPLPLLRWGAKVLGQAPVYARLCESLWVDDSETRRCLEWRPPLSTNMALESYLQ